jgi:hypothetical protein
VFRVSGVCRMRGAFRWVGRNGDHPGIHFCLLGVI